MSSGPERRSHPYSYHPTPDPNGGRDSSEYSMFESTSDPIYIGVPNSPYGQSDTRKRRSGKARTALVFVVCLSTLAVVFTLGRRSAQIADYLGYALEEYVPTKKVMAIDACGICSSSPKECKEYGLESLQLGRAFAGTGRRLRKVIRKAMRGEKIKTAVIGGSVSEGVGVEIGQRWHELTSAWFRDTFPNTEVEHVIGAVPGRGSEYFQSCHGQSTFSARD